MKFSLLALSTILTSLLVFPVASAQMKTGFMPMKQAVIDVNRAYLSPREFTTAFGGTFESNTLGRLVWEYNGVQLEFKTGSPIISSLIDQTNFNLMSPVQEKDGRTVLEANIVFRFQCSLARTDVSQAQILVTCGSGQTLQTQMLKRY